MNMNNNIKNLNNDLEKKFIAFVLPTLEIGGAEKMTLNLIQGLLNFGYKIDLILIDAKGPLLKNVPKGCNIIDFKLKHVFFSFLKIIKYLKKNTPTVLISSLTHLNIITILSVLISRVKTKLIIMERANLSSATKNNNLKVKFVSILAHFLYKRADFIIAVSEGVKQDLLKKIQGIENKIRVIYNPVLNKDIFLMSYEPVYHKWFLEKNMPIILSVGRLSKEKNYSILLQAFKLIKDVIKCKLVIIGEGPERENLENLAKSLQINEDLWMPGFDINPYKYMSKSDIFVLTSIYEGLSNVLIEALALGLPLVSTDCESGPREIIKNNINGLLVKVGDYKSLSQAIIYILKNRNKFITNMNELERFKLENVVYEYKNLIDNLSENLFTN
ncbi:MAG TPA: glycosyltransferase [Caldisericia bacterium]|nr:glycosyltransferase [Caldisericia bacterium]